MAIVLKTLKFGGVRSFERNENQFHQVEFHPKMTIIKGRNGCGKTTILECLGFAFTGKITSSPDKLRSFINGLQTGTVARIVIEFVKGEFTYIIDWLLERPNKDIRATCKITCDGLTIHERLASKDAETKIKEILELPSGAVDKLLLVTQEDTFWPFATAKNLKEGMDKLQCLEESNTILDELVTRRKALQSELKEVTPLLKPACDNAAAEEKAREENRTARDDQQNLRTFESSLEKQNKDWQSRLDNYNKIKELEMKLRDEQNIINALQISPDEISRYNQTSLNMDMHQIRTQLIETNETLQTENTLKLELQRKLDLVSKQYDTAFEANIRALVKKEKSENAKLEFETMSQTLSQSMSQDPDNIETDISNQILEYGVQLKAVDGTYQVLFDEKTDNERKKVQIETVLDENSKNLETKKHNLAQMKEKLKMYSVQDQKLSILQQKVLEFDEKMKSHDLVLLKNQLANANLMELYKTELPAVNDITKKLGIAEGSLAANEEVLEELRRLPGTDIKSIIYQRIQNTETLKVEIKQLEKGLERMKRLKTLKL